MKSFMASPATIERKWYVVDATGYTLGRLSSRDSKGFKRKEQADFHTSYGLRRLCNRCER